MKKKLTSLPLGPCALNKAATWKSNNKGDNK